MTDTHADNQAICDFRSYLQINTAHPQPDYGKCVDFLRKIADEIDAEFSVHEMAPGAPTVVLTVRGDEPKLKSVLLSSHMDVVPVTAEDWDCDPFAAHMTADRDIVARGAQDMKCVGIGYIAAMRQLRNQPRRRTIHLVFTPDEEIGSARGAALFANSDAFAALNVGVCLDEGCPSPHERVFVFNAERSAWWIKLTARGDGGHGSTMPQGTAVERLLRALGEFSAWRSEESRKLALVDGRLGKVCSINITMLQAGKQANVIPESATAYIDIRVSPERDKTEIEGRIQTIASAEGLSFAFVNRYDSVHVSPVDAESPFWDAIKTAFAECRVDMETDIFPGATDSRFYRAVGVPSYGLSPFTNTIPRLHGRNEYMNADTFLAGIKIYASIIYKLANVPSQRHQQ